MAIIAFDDSFCKEERIILSKTFSDNCKFLRMDQHDFTVQVRRFHIGNAGHYGRVVHPAPRFFEVEMNSTGFNLFDATSCLGHEAVHMRQHLDGRLQHIAGPNGTLWKGEFFPEHYTEDTANYADLPWEQEAFELQGVLHISALKSLGSELLRKINPHESNGLSELFVKAMKDFDNWRQKAA